jgi:hypothetical protein
MWRIEGAKLPSVVAGKLCHATLATGYLRMIKLTQYTFKHFFIDKCYYFPVLDYLQMMQIFVVRTRFLICLHKQPATFLTNLKQEKINYIPRNLKKLEL